MELARLVPSFVLRLMAKYELQVLASLPFVAFIAFLLPTELIVRAVVTVPAQASWQYWESAALILPLLAFLAGLATAMWILDRLIDKGTRRRLLDDQRSGAAIRSLPWREFETFVAAAFSQAGWKAEVVGKAGPDGGVDVVLRRKKEKAVVQCKKRGFTSFIAERDVREFVGVITAEKAARGFFVTTGVFSPEAIGFAEKVANLELVTAADLFGMMGRCPKCGSEMILKDGSRGPFMSCATFPVCRGAADIPAAA